MSIDPTSFNIDNTRIILVEILTPKQVTKGILMVLLLCRNLFKQILDIPNIDPQKSGPYQRAEYLLPLKNFFNVSYLKWSIWSLIMLIYFTKINRCSSFTSIKSLLHPIFSPGFRIVYH